MEGIFRNESEAEIGPLERRLFFVLPYDASGLRYTYFYHWQNIVPGKSRGQKVFTSDRFPYLVSAARTRRSHGSLSRAHGVCGTVGCGATDTRTRRSPLTQIHLTVT